MKSFKASEILKFKKFLDDINYHFLLTTILGESTYHINPLPEYHFVKKELKKINKKYIDIVSFLLLGEPIEKQSLNLPISLIEHLYDLKILNMDDEHYWLNNYLLTSYSNCYFLVGNVYYYPTCQNQIQKPYIGADTFWLSRIIVNRLSGNVLDLCTGSGIQAILAAKTANHVIAIDIDEESAKIANFNTILNNVSDKVEIRVGDLYDSLEENIQFDYITSNPPFIPIPSSVKFPIAGDGGEDGKTIVKKIFRGYKKHLKPLGTAIMIGQAIGNSDSVFLTKEIEEILCNIDTTVYYSNKIPINNQSLQFSELANRLNCNYNVSPELWNTIYKNLGANYFYNFTLFTKNECGNLEIVKIDDSWDSNDVPIFTYSDIIKFSENHSLKSNNSNIVVDDEIVYLIKNCKNKSIYEAVQSMPFIYKIKYGKEAESKMLAKYLNILSVLEREGLVKKAGSK